MDLEAMIGKSPAEQLNNINSSEKYIDISPDAFMEKCRFKCIIVNSPIGVVNNGQAVVPKFARSQRFKDIDSVNETLKDKIVCLLNVVMDKITNEYIVRYYTLD